MKIPRHIYCTLPTEDIPSDFKILKLINNIREKYPDYTVHIFDDNKCRNFIKNNFNTVILYCYDMLLPGAFKADLWRYCVLYQHGGIYIDAGLEPVVDLNKYLDYDLVCVKDTNIFGNNNVYNAFLCSTPKNPFSAKAA